MKQSNYSEPLYVDTTIEYAIDRSRFPGIDNGQPMLLIHSNTSCSCFQARRKVLTPVADHELFHLIDSLDDVTCDSGVLLPEYTSNSRDTESSPIGPLLETPTDETSRDVISDVVSDEEKYNPESILDTSRTCPDSWSSSDSNPSALLDDQFFPSFRAVGDFADLSGYFSTICEDSLLDIGISRKRRHSTVHEECSKRQRSECISWVADLLEDEADYRGSG